jgi:hypothetical protein
MRIPWCKEHCSMSIKIGMVFELMRSKMYTLRNDLIKPPLQVRIKPDAAQSHHHYSNSLPLCDASKRILVAGVWFFFAVPFVSFTVGSVRNSLLI